MQIKQENKLEPSEWRRNYKQLEIIEPQKTSVLTLESLEGSHGQIYGGQTWAQIQYDSTYCRAQIGKVKMQKLIAFH